MEAKELRIGNWIADRGDKQWQIHNFDNNKVESEPPILEIEQYGLVEGHPLTLIQHWEKEVPFAQKWGVYLEYAKNISKQLLADMLWDVWNWYSNGEMEYEEAQRAAIKKHLKF